MSVYSRLESSESKEAMKLAKVEQVNVAVKFEIVQVIIAVHFHETFSTSDHFKIARIQEHVLPLHDLTMLNSAVSSVQHHITLR